MKRVLGLILVGMLLFAGCASASENALTDLVTYIADNPTALNYGQNHAFSSDPADAPSDEELVTMLEFANLIGAAHMLSPAHFIVIRDYEEQSKILSTAVTQGTVTVLVLSDNLRTQEHHEAEYNGWYDQMYYGIFDSGSAMAYLNIAANSLGYKTHPLAMITLPVDGEIDIANGGKFSLIQGDNWAIDPYTASKDGEVEYAHTIAMYALGAGAFDIKVKDNLTLLTTIVIGKTAEGIDAVSAATQAVRPSNYNFWDPQDGTSYGNVYVEGVNHAAQASNEQPWAELPDGTYTGKSASTSSQYTIAATIEGGKIIAIDVVEGQENMYSDAQQLKTFTDHIMMAQSLSVDAVSGATQDCEGVIVALEEAFS